MDTAELDCTEELPHEERRSDAALAEFREQVDQLTREIQELPQVRSVKCTSRGDNPQLNRAIAQLCCHNGMKSCTRLLIRSLT